MEFSGMLDERLKSVAKLAGVECGARVVEERDGVSFYGYPLVNCRGNKGGIQAGVVVREGGIGGFYYRDGEEECIQVFRQDLMLGELGKALDELVKTLAENPSIGCIEWVDLLQAGKEKPRLLSRECVANEKTGGRVVKLDSVLVDFGFAQVFASMVLGWSEGEYILALADPKVYWENGRKRVRYVVLYEAGFSSAEEGNNAFKKVKKSCFLSKKGNKVYRLEKEDFSRWFKRVEGASLNLD